MEMEVHRDLGKHDAQIDGLEKQIQALHDDMQKLNAVITEIQQTLYQAKGGWRTLMWVCGASAAFGVTATKVVTWLTAVPVPK